jgi:hypothetical protein
MMYGNKTSTDVNQCSPLEPWMFTLILLWWASREDSENWRHLGFMPSQDFIASQEQDTVSNNSHKGLSLPSRS